MEIPYGYCHCGCGEKTKLITQSNRRLGFIRGEPSRFLFNHSSRKKRTVVVQPADTSICYIGLTQGQHVTVDAFIYDWLVQWIWRAYWNPSSQGYYACCTYNGKTIWMHRVITNAPEGVIIDHEDRNGLNNRGSNLRFSTQKQNQYNTVLCSRNTSGYKGVSWSPKYKCWRSNIMDLDGIHRSLGHHKTKDGAARAYDEKAIEIHGKFARLNFPLP